jgi:1,4-alpha-glucan branching enzyme
VFKNGPVSLVRNVSAGTPNTHRTASVRRGTATSTPTRLGTTSAARGTAVSVGAVPKKAYSKTGAACRVTFELPADAGAEKVALAGDFNDWSTDVGLLSRRRDGRFTATLTLPAGGRFRFRYWVDGGRWENDRDADDYVPNAYGGEDSVVVT